jgi:nucleotide-binding universal stress UspA family protein
MRWIVAIELRHRSTAAVRFARWLADTAGARWTDDFVGVHVLDADHLAYVLRSRHLDEVVDEARAAAEEEVARASSGLAPPRVDVVQALTIADGLESARERHQADGVVVARVARSESHHLLRLGDVGRKLLTRLSSPVVVVPPAFAPAAAGAGAVLALTRLDEESLPACQLAAAVAASAGRALTLAGVAERDDDGITEANVARWARRHDLTAERCALVRGDLAEAGLAFAARHRAALLAVGARPRRGISARFGARRVHRLAAASEVPLLVVPARGEALEAARSRSGSVVGAGSPGAAPSR